MASDQSGNRTRDRTRPGRVPQSRTVSDRIGPVRRRLPGRVTVTGIRTVTAGESKSRPRRRT
eukprot:761380-Hanusia_phi.AAC.1